MCDYTELECRELTTRKERQCPWCAELIQPRERAQLRVYLFEGDFQREYLHPECYAAMLNADPYRLCEGFFEGEYPRGCSVPWECGGQRDESLPKPTDERLKEVIAGYKENAWKY